MRYKAAIMALALACAPWFSTVSFAGFSDRNATQPVSLPYIGASTSSRYTAPSWDSFQQFEMDMSDDQSDVDPGWKSLRTFQLTQTNTRPLKVYIDSSARNPKLFKPAYANYVAEGLQAWSDALDGRLKYELTTNPREAQIRVYWVTGFAIPEQAGETEYTIGDASIKIQTVHMPENIIKGNIYHELGHALGLGEHSSYNNDIMVACHEWSSYREYKTYSARLSERDKQAIRRLYGSNWRKGEDVYQALSNTPAVRIAATPDRRTGTR